MKALSPEDSRKNGQMTCSNL